MADDEKQQFDMHNVKSLIVEQLNHRMFFAPATVSMTIQSI